MDVQVFLAEIVVNSYCLPKYFCSSMFWLDFLAAASLLGDIPFIAAELFPSGFAAARASRAGRAARAGTRVGRLMRLTRLIRIIRIMRMAQKRKARKLGMNGDPGGTLSGQARAGSLNVKMTEMTVSKVVVGVLIMLLCMPFLEVSFVSLTRQDGLELIARQAAAGADQASVEAAVSLYKEHHATELYEFHLDEPTPMRANNGNGNDNSNGTAPFVGPLDWKGTPSPLLRDSEIRVAWVPQTVDLEFATSYAYFDVRAGVREEAVFSVATTSFIIFLLGIGPSSSHTHTSPDHHLSIEH